MNKKAIIPAVIGFTAGAVLKCIALQKKRNKEIKEIAYSIAGVLTDIEICNFHDFANTLYKKYGIKAVEGINGDVVYFSDKITNKTHSFTSKEVSKYLSKTPCDMHGLEKRFASHKDDYAVYKRLINEGKSGGRK